MPTGIDQSPQVTQGEREFLSKRMVEAGPRLANVIGKGRLSPVDFFPRPGLELAPRLWEV
jgi:hypothetical protein